MNQSSYWRDKNAELAAKNDALRQQLADVTNERDKWSKTYALAMADNLKLTANSSKSGKLLRRVIDSGALSYQGREMLSGLEADICATLAQSAPATEPCASPGYPPVPEGRKLRATDEPMGNCSNCGHDRIVCTCGQGAGS